MEAPSARTLGLEEGLALDRRGVQAYVLGSFHPMRTCAVGAEAPGYVFKMR